MWTGVEGLCCAASRTSSLVALLCRSYTHLFNSSTLVDVGVSTSERLLVRGCLDSSSSSLGCVTGVEE